MRRLPPLDTLRVFEAAERHKSFKKAADELAVTTSAVSHRMAALEEELGTILFAPVSLTTPSSVAAIQRFTG